MTTELPLVSIIIPTYNYGHLIGETISCLKEQTYAKWEAIIVDDGSIDNTESVVKKFALEDSRIIYIKQENKGVSNARNTGLKHAKGDYIQFLDADDLISQYKIKLQIEYFEEHKEMDICLVNALFFNNNSKKKLYTDLLLKNESKTQIVNGSGYLIVSAFLETNLSVIESPLFKKYILEKTGKFKEDMHYLEDWDFWFRVAINNFNFKFLTDTKAFVLIRSHDKSATKQSNKIKVAEGRLRNLFNDYVFHSELLLENEKKELIQRNNELLINTFKDIMAKTSFLEFTRFLSYYREMNSSSKFIWAFIKSINLKRKLSKIASLV